MAIVMIAAAGRAQISAAEASLDRLLTRGLRTSLQRLGEEVRVVRERDMQSSRAARLEGLRLGAFAGAERARGAAAKARPGDLVISQSPLAALFASTRTPRVIYDAVGFAPGIPPIAAGLARYWARGRRIAVTGTGERRVAGGRRALLGAGGRDHVVAGIAVDLARFQDLPNSAVAKLRTGRVPTGRIAVYAPVAGIDPVAGIQLVAALAEEVEAWEFVVACPPGLEASGTRALARERTLRNLTVLEDVAEIHLPDILAMGDVLLAPETPPDSALDSPEVRLLQCRMLELLAAGRAVVAGEGPVLDGIGATEAVRRVHRGRAIEWVHVIRSLAVREPRERVASFGPDVARRFDMSARARTYLAVGSSMGPA